MDVVSIGLRLLRATPLIYPARWLKRAMQGLRDRLVLPAIRRIQALEADRPRLAALEQLAEQHLQRVNALEQRLTVQAEHQAAQAERLATFQTQLLTQQAELHAQQTQLLTQQEQLRAHEQELVGLQRHNATLTEQFDRAGTHLRHLDHEVKQQRETLLQHSASIRWLVEHPPQPASGSSHDSQRPRVSIIMPVHNRQALVGRAIESVLAQTCRAWELLVVDDGSSDASAAEVERYLGDARIRLVRQEHAGVCAARNRGLAESQAELIAYLDSDNVWYPGTLDTLVRAFDEEPDCASVYAALLWCDLNTGRTAIHAAPFDHARMLEMSATIDLNSFAHRRSLYERLGGFDPTLTRLVDWDLILRYTAETPPRLLPIVAGRYEAGTWERITGVENFSLNVHRVRRKFERPLPSPLRVLLVLWQHPQLSETYITAEIDFLLRRGVEVHTWSDVEPVSPYTCPSIQHRGPLGEVLDRVKPDLAHLHWLHGERYVDEIARRGIPITIRGHSFENHHDLVPRLVAHPGVSRLYLFPHQVRRFQNLGDKIVSLKVGFNPDRFGPARDKDRRLVLRLGTALPTKGLPLFLRLAARCPEFRFVLGTIHTAATGSLIEELIALNRSLGSPAEMYLNMPHDEAVAWTHRAGIYLHTMGAPEGFGMPISVAEAMATGAYTLALRCPAAEEYLGDPSRCYADEDEAARLLQATLTWDAQRWRQVQHQAIEQAYAHHVDSVALEPLLTDWLHLVAARRTRAPGRWAA
ncbi:MAG: glycosyltransferase [Gemmataceae bacterium]